MDALSRLNALSDAALREELRRCCAASRFVERLAGQRPFRDPAQLLAAADAALHELQPEDWRAAFAQHPRIGDKTALRARFTSTAAWATQEQAGTVGASADLLEALAEGNRAYETRFGYIFIVCASGKGAAEMLGLLEERLRHEPEAELRIAAAEQAKITRLRLQKLLSS